MKKNNVKAEELTFKEEVPDEELHSKLGVDDHIYITRRRFFGLPLLAFLGIVLGLSLLFSVLLSYVYVNNDKSDRPIGVINNKYNLVVSHSNEKFGGVIPSFANYSSDSKAFEYAFSVSNGNDIDLRYSVELINNNYKFEKPDMSLIHYNLIKNGESIKVGTLKNDETNRLYKTNIKSSVLDRYTIKLWSDSLTNKVNFNFKINVGV